MNDEEFKGCIKTMADGDISGLRSIYDAYLKMIYAICLNVLKNKEAAEDVASDFFIKLYKDASKYDTSKVGHKSWLVTMAKNMCIDYIRKYNRESLSLDDEIDEDEGDGTTEKDLLADDSVDTAEQAVDKVLLEEAKKTLKPKEREIIDMKILGGYTFQEISEAIGMPMGTVTWQYREGLKKLRRYIQDGR